MYCGCRAQFIRNNRGINDDKDLPREYLENLFDEIKTKQIQVRKNVVDLGSHILCHCWCCTSLFHFFGLVLLAVCVQVDMDIRDTSSESAIDFSDVSAWNKLLHKSAAFQAPAAFTPTVAARKGARGRGSGKSSHGHGHVILVHEKDMFLVIAKSVLDTIVLVWEVTRDDSTLQRYFFRLTLLPCVVILTFFLFLQVD